MGVKVGADARARSRGGPGGSRMAHSVWGSESRDVHRYATLCKKRVSCIMVVLDA